MTGVNYQRHKGMSRFQFPKFSSLSFKNTFQPLPNQGTNRAVAMSQSNFAFLTTAGEMFLSNLKAKFSLYQIFTNVFWAPAHIFMGIIDPSQFTNSRKGYAERANCC